MMSRTLIVALVLFVAACSDEPESKTTTPPDPVPLRSLTTKSLFGQMPIENRFLDPQFALVDGNAWLPFTDSWNDWPNVVQSFVPHTPLGQPTLYLPKASNAPGLGVVGNAKSLSGPMEVSIWAGRNVDAQDLELSQVEAALVGTFPDGATDGINLQVDTTSAQLLGEIAWYRLVAELPAGPVGWCQFYLVDNSTTEDLWLSSPMLVPAPELSMRVAQRRPLTPRQARAIAMHTDQQRDRL